MALSSFDPIHSAMLSMDLQSGIVSIYARDDGLVTRAGTDNFRVTIQGIEQ